MDCCVHVIRPPSTSTGNAASRERCRLRKSITQYSGSGKLISPQRWERIASEGFIHRSRPFSSAHAAHVNSAASGTSVMKKFIWPTARSSTRACGTDISSKGQSVNRGYGFPPSHTIMQSNKLLGPSRLRISRVASRKAPGGAGSARTTPVSAKTLRMAATRRAKSAGLPTPSNCPSAIAQSMECTWPPGKTQRPSGRSRRQTQ
mmetsp:Transcript_95015/g.188228  ORF Transcript_95015/g.188228 Transcript_95015/m.188228 type:complete len:204 (-) Transcript_95015:177-788(-)